MFYLISENELTAIQISLKSADVSTEIIEEIRKPERISLITWSGEDVIKWIKKHANCSKNSIVEIINEVGKTLANYECSNYYEDAVYQVLKERGYWNE